jgi:two-component system cell cycle response regulator
MSVPHYTSAVRPAVLIVDDYVDALFAWEIFLRAEGFDVVTASSGPEALDSARRAVPNVIVMDLALPGLSGCEVARALRAESATRHIPLIAATGAADPMQLDEARAAGFDTILAKPLDPMVLVSKIRELLDAGARQ